MALPRGARPSPRHRLAAAAPHRPIVPLLGLPDSFGVVPSTLSYWLNDVDGDCVTAESAAAKAAYSLYPGGSGTELVIPDASVQAWASKHGVLDGAVIVEVLDLMETDGLVGPDGKAYTEGPHQSVDWTSWTTLCSAILQGPVKVGVAAAQLEAACSPGKNGWTGYGWKEDANYDHCVSLFGYGTFATLCPMVDIPVQGSQSAVTPAVLLFTWDSVGILEWSSLCKITCEAWVRTPTTPQSPVVPPAPKPGPILPGPAGGWPSGWSIADRVVGVNLTRGQWVAEDGGGEWQQRQSNGPHTVIHPKMREVDVPIGYRQA